MAARSARSSARMADEPSSGKCSCNIGWMVGAWVLVAIGIWGLVGGLATQFTSAAPTSLNVGVLGWYFVGIVFVSLGKMAKWKAHGSCRVHKMG